MLKGETPSTERPGKHLPPVDLDAARQELRKTLDDEEIDDEDLAAWLMYPKVFTDYRLRHRDYGPVRTLPTPVFFYGMKPGDEVSVELSQGKTLEIRYQTRSDTDEQGQAADHGDVLLPWQFQAAA